MLAARLRRTTSILSYLGGDACTYVGCTWRTCLRGLFGERCDFLLHVPVVPSRQKVKSKYHKYVASVHKHHAYAASMQM